MDFLNDYMETFEHTESPRSFWLWSGIFTVLAALQRRVWIEFGTDPIYPSLYLIVIADPGKCRKNAPNSMARRLLRKAGLNLAPNKLTGRALTKAMHGIEKSDPPFEHDGEKIKQTTLSIVSSELAEILVDPGMIEDLTTLYDTPDEWDYSTASVGKDHLENVACGVYVNTTPRYIAENLPPTSVGGGLMSRFIILYETKKYQWLSFPPAIAKEKLNYLVSCIKKLKEVTGPVKLSDEAYKVYDEWYLSFEGRKEVFINDAVKGNLSRLHTNALKVATALHFAHDLETNIINAQDMQTTINLVEAAFGTAAEAFSAHGRSSISLDIKVVSQQIYAFTEMNGYATLPELMDLNYKNLGTRAQLLEVLDTICAIGAAECEEVTIDNKLQMVWVSTEKGK